MNKLTKLYADILTSVDCVIEDDYVLYDYGQGKGLEPLTVRVDGKVRKLVIPTKNMQKNGDWSDIVAFHPACESVFKGQSEIINTLVNLIGLKLYLGIQFATNAMIALAIDDKVSGRLSLAQKRLVTPLSDATKTVFGLMEQVTRKSSGTSGKTALLNVKLARGKTIDGQTYTRACFLKSPLLKGGTPILDVKGSVANHNALMAAYETAFPTKRVVGSNSGDTPYLDCLLEMFYIAATHLNGIKVTLDKYCGEMKTIDTSWFEELVDLNSYYKKYLPLSYPGNVGVGDDGETTQQVPPSGQQASNMVRQSNPQASSRDGADSRTGIPAMKISKPVIRPDVAPAAQPTYEAPPQQMYQPVPQQMQYQQPVHQPIQPQMQYQQPVQQQLQPQMHYQQPEQEEQLSHTQLLNRMGGNMPNAFAGNGPAYVGVGRTAPQPHYQQFQQQQHVYGRSAYIQPQQNLSASQLNGYR